MCAVRLEKALGESPLDKKGARREGIGFVVGALLLAILLAPGVTWGQEPASKLDQKVTESFHGPDGQGKEGPMVKIGEDLIRLYHEFEQHRAAKRGEPFTPTQEYLPVRTGEWVVIDAVAQGTPEVLQARLEEMGLRRGAIAGRLVSGLVPIEALDEIAQLAALNEARPALAITGVGATTSQGDVALYTDSLRSISALNGEGVKIGALSDSYDNHEGFPATIAADDVQTGDLPGAGNPNGYSTPVEVLDDGVEASDEGRAMLQIIHDIAPAAELAFHTAFRGRANFAQGIRDLSDVGSEVIVDDIFYFAEPMFQDGAITQAIQDVVAGGAVYATSAGNAGEEAYASAFRNSGDQLSSILGEGEEDLHDFDSGMGTDTRQQITVGGGQTLYLTLQWDDPYYSVSGEPGADTDLDVYLLDGSTVVRSSTRRNVGGDPVEVIIFENTGDQALQLDLSIARAEGPEPEHLKYVIFRGAQIDEHRTNSPTVSGHSNAEGAISVAAAAWFNTPRQPTGTGEDPPLVNAFSSKGGTPLFFDRDGNRLDPPRERRKPDLTGPDGVNTTFFGSDIPQDDPDSNPNFFGTSAAAPHVAAVAALMRQARPGISPETVRSQMKASALDIVERYVFGDERRSIPNGEGYDFFSGSGLIRADVSTLDLLPVRVVRLEGMTQGNREEVHLDWMTVQEMNSYQFIVEYRPAGQRENPRAGGWYRAGAVASLASDGESSDTLQYDFAAAIPSPGRYVFRLKHEQQDGTTQEVGPRIDVRVPFQGAFELGGPQPNPTRHRAEVQLVVEDGQRVRLDLYDTIGRRVRTLYDDHLEADRPLLSSIRTQDLASGVYFLRVVGDTFQTTRRLVRIK